MVIKKLENLCPVCGFQMEEPPKDCNICPSCGTEFGVHDVNSSIQELRAAWIATGPRWWSVTDPQPAEWNPFAQLAAIASSGAVVASEPVFVVDSTSTSSPSSVNITGVDSGSWVLVQLEDTPLEAVA